MSGATDGRSPRFERVCAPTPGDLAAVARAGEAEQPVAGEADRDDHEHHAAERLLKHLVQGVVEAAGKIASANADHAKAVELREAILDALESQARMGAKQNIEAVRLGLTAVLLLRAWRTGGFRMLAMMDG